MIKGKHLKNYIYINRTALLLCIYVIFFPIISIPIKKIIPSFGNCAYLAITGKPCPLCGGTRYIQNLNQVFHNWRYLLHPFGIIVLFIFFEIIFRLIILHIYIKRKKQNCLELNKKLIIIDIIIHFIVFIIFTIYEIAFIIYS